MKKNNLNKKNIILLVLIIAVILVAPRIKDLTGKVFSSPDCIRATGVKLGTDHTCILLENGNVDCSGDIYYDYPNVNIPDYYTLEHVESIASEFDHTCFLISGGNVHCYGRGTERQAIDYTGGDAIAVATGFHHTCILLENGNVNCYGSNTYGQAPNYQGVDAVGISTGSYHTCILLKDGDVDCYGFNVQGQAIDYTGGDAIGVSAGTYHTCILLKNGNVNCYGSNDFGQTITYEEENAIGLEVSERNTCILLKNGNVNCYGDDYYDQTITYEGGNAIGVDTAKSHTCILLENGNVNCYAKYNNDGKADNFNSGCTEAPTCTDLDLDGYGDPANPACTYPELDCDDTSPDCNLDCITDVDTDGIRDCEDLDITLAPTCTDLDLDGYGDPANPACTYPELDCDDTSPDCNLDCITDVDTDGIRDCEDLDITLAPTCTDLDLDGYGDPANPACTYPELDCDDTSPDCNLDCITDVDTDGIRDCEDLDITLAPTCTDLDLDGYGDPANPACTYPELDCDDTSPDCNLDCITDVDTDGIRDCEDLDITLAPTCTENALRCTGNDLELCTANIWNVDTDCSLTGETCDDTIATPACTVTPEGCRLGECDYYDICIPAGTRVDYQYCDLTGSEDSTAAGLKDQVVPGETCEHNFECISNICDIDTCISYSNLIDAYCWVLVQLGDTTNPICET